MYSRGLCSPKEMLIVRSQNPLQVDRPLTTLTQPGQLSKALPGAKIADLAVTLSMTLVKPGKTKST